jgi:hypothetical protein
MRAPHRTHASEDSSLLKDFDLVRFGQDDHGVFVIDSSHHTISALRTHWPTRKDAEQAIQKIWEDETTAELEAIKTTSPVVRYLDWIYVH